MYIQIINYNDETSSASDPSGIGRIGDDGGGGGDSDVLYTYAIQKLLQTMQTVTIKEHIQSLKPRILSMEWMSM